MSEKIAPDYPKWAYTTSSEQVMAEMGYSVIYSVDIPRSEYIGRYLPNQSLRRKFTQTEGDDQYDYGYLEGAWKHGKHRKLCAILNAEQFDQFVTDCGLYAEDVETMGSLGAPGFGVGWAPAISFRSDDDIAIQSAYVTPIPFIEDENWPKPDNEAQANTVWYMIRQLVLNKYGV